MEDIGKKAQGAEDIALANKVKGYADAAGALASIWQATGKNADLVAGIQVAQAIADTYAGAAKAFKQGGVLGFVSGAAIIAQGLSYVTNISRSLGDLKKAATGYDGVVNKPTMFLAGEAGAESVQITPLNSAMNINGVQGGGSNITLNISAPLVDDTVVDISFQP